MAKTTFFQKIALFFFALGVTLLILESVLRLGGWVFLSAQENVNRKNAGSGGEYRILCLGESTTALGGNDSYPRQLERILNSRQDKIKFKVINKGVPATTTGQIIARAESYFVEYRPHMVVAMMGINDPGDNGQARWTWRDQLSLYSKAFKLFDMLVRHLSAKSAEVPYDFVEQQIAKIEAQASQNPAARISVELAKANLYRSANRPALEKEAIEKVLALDPENSQAWYLLGIHYDRHAEHQKALDAYRKAVRKAGPDEKLRIFEHMAQNHKFLGDDQAAIEIYKGILKQWPRHTEANGALADVLLEQGNYEEAVGFYLKQSAIDPRKADIDDKLAHCYRKMGLPQEAERVLVKKQEKESFGSGETPKKLGAAWNSKTKENYLRLIKIAGQYRVPVLAMQYPSRPIAPLKDMLAGTAGVVFVDHEKTFADALAREGYDNIFTDRFAGDFGHCTPRGNSILAGYLADAIIGYLNIETRQ